jgi:hypothetical protein
MTRAHFTLPCQYLAQEKNSWSTKYPIPINMTLSYCQIGAYCIVFYWNNKQIRHLLGNKYSAALKMEYSMNKRYGKIAISGKSCCGQRGETDHKQPSSPWHKLRAILWFRSQLKEGKVTKLPLIARVVFLSASPGSYEKPTLTHLQIKCSSHVFLDKSGRPQCVSCCGIGIILPRHAISQRKRPAQFSKDWVKLTWFSQDQRTGNRSFDIDNISVLASAKEFCELCIQPLEIFVCVCQNKLTK